MTDKTLNKSRRDAVKLMLGGAVAVPFINLVGVSGARAADLPHVDAKADPTAIALKYTDDATTATRADKAGTPGAEQHCANLPVRPGHRRLRALHPVPRQGRVLQGLVHVLDQEGLSSTEVRST